MHTYLATTLYHVYIVYVFYMPKMCLNIALLHVIWVKRATACQAPFSRLDLSEASLGWLASIYTHGIWLQHKTAARNDAVYAACYKMEDCFASL